MVQRVTKRWQRLEGFPLLGKLVFLPSNQERSQVGPIAKDGLFRTNEPRRQLVHKDLDQRVIERRLQRFPGKCLMPHRVGRSGHRVPRQRDDEAGVALGEVDALLPQHLLHLEQGGARRRRRQLQLAGVQGLAHERPLTRNESFECPNFMTQVQRSLRSFEAS